MVTKQKKDRVKRLLDVRTRARRDPQMRIAVQTVEAINRAAELVRTLRRSKNLTQKELGTMLGVSQARISQIESGSVENSPSIEVLSDIAGRCGERLYVTLASEIYDLQASLKEARSETKALRREIESLRAPHSAERPEVIVHPKRVRGEIAKKTPKRFGSKSGKAAQFEELKWTLLPSKPAKPAKPARRPKSRSGKSRFVDS